MSESSLPTASRQSVSARTARISSATEPKSETLARRAATGRPPHATSGLESRHDGASEDPEKHHEQPNQEEPIAELHDSSSGGSPLNRSTVEPLTSRAVGPLPTETRWRDAG